jgi:hypothetical protein
MAWFYGELWNRWNDSAVEDTLSPGFAFRGSLGQEASGRHGWRRYRDLVRAGSADFRNEIVELICDRGRRHGGVLARGAFEAGQVGGHGEPQLICAGGRRIGRE